MKTKKLRSIVLAFCLIVFFNTTWAGTYYFRNSAPAPTTDPALRTNWTVNANGVGGASPNAAQWAAANTLNFYNSTGAVTATLTAAWSTLNAGSTLTIGDGTRAASFGLGPFNNAVQRLTTVSANATISASNASPTYLTSYFTFNAASTTILSNASVTVPGMAASASYGNLTLSGATATLGGLVTVSGTFSANAIIFSSQTLVLNGTVTAMGTVTGDVSAFLNCTNTGSFSLAMDQTTVGTTNTMNTITYNSMGGTLTLANALCISPGGNITPTLGTIDVGTGLLTLQASQSQTGAIGTIGGTLTAGTITSMMYHNPAVNNTNWTTLASPGVSGASYQWWRTGFPITCSSCIDGCCAGGFAFTSINYYDESAGGVDYNDALHYSDIVSDGDEIPSAVSATHAGQGVWVYMGNSTPGTATAAETIQTDGTPVTGNQGLNFTFTGAAHAYNLLGNPYPSPISWSSVMALASNAAVAIDGVAYIYDASTGGNGTIAADGTANGGQGLVDDVIPIGMAFFVKATASGTLNFDETVKSVGGAQDLQRHSAPHSTQAQIAQRPKFVLQAMGPAGMQSKTTISFNSAASVGRDYISDAAYMIGAEPLRVSTQIGGKDFSINGLPDLNQNYSIPVKMVTNTTGTYTISALQLNKLPAGACIILHDNYNGGVNYDLHNGPFTLTLSDTETVARFVLNITIDNSLTLTANTFQTSCSSTNNGYVTAIGNDAGPWNYTWKDANNNIVKTSLNVVTEDSLKGLGVGVYSVDVNTVGTCKNASQTFTVTIAPPTSLSISTNVVPATCSTTYDGYITSVGNSSGPWNYTWKDASNNVMMTVLNKTTADTLFGLDSGVYSVEVSTAGVCDLGVQSFTITAPSAPTSAFTVASNTVTVSTAITFTNNSTNATDFWWTFGDGSTSNLQNPMYTYNSIGTETVTLYAFNPVCNDTVNSIQVITVEATTAVASHLNNSEIILVKDQSGTYVKFNYGSQTRVNINVYNALGQAVLVNQSQMVTNEKIYLNLENAKDQMIFVSIGNLDKNTQVTKKLYNN